jgi:tetratricopeptide (TPR) repeat protein
MSASARLPRANRLGLCLRWLVVFLAAAGWSQHAAAELSAEQRRVILDEAQALYDRGVAERRADPETAQQAFVDSAARFQQLVDDGVVNGPLYYNLANAHLQAGEIGRAILHYRRAEQLIPGDGRLAHNLDYARSLRRNRIPPSGERALARALLIWHYKTSLTARFGIFSVAYLLFWLVLLLHLFRPAALWRWSAVVLALLWVACGLSVVVDLAHQRGADEGVVLVDDVVVRKGNGEGFEPQFEQPLHQGVEFEVLDRRADWLQIELPDGKSGWIPAGTAGLINQAYLFPAPLPGAG